MTEYIVSRGEYVVYNIVVEAEGEAAAEAAAKEVPLEDERWRVCGPTGQDTLYQCEGPYPRRR